ncbi:MAG: carboxypeptidase regulatory-like domain-containing protein, partial [Crocinitomicaceae bacterium]|nr:carboxypeptidase regulatory-like domain-containing protein [Crocinitomicaceae bacterium]
MKTRLLSKICGLMVFFPLVTLAQTSVQGVVSKSGTTNPIIGANVIIDDNVNYMATSNAEGNYEIKNVPEGIHKVQFTHPDFDTLSIDVELKGSTPI